MSSWLQSLSQHLEEKIQKVKLGSGGSGGSGGGGGAGETKQLPSPRHRVTSLPSTAIVHIPSYSSGTTSSPSSNWSARSSSGSSSDNSNAPSPILLHPVKSPSSSGSTLSSFLSLAGGTSRNHVFDEDSREGSNEHSTPTAWLTIHLIEAKDLVVADRSGTSDPYVIFRVKGASGKIDTVKSSVITKTLNPKWDETYNLLIAKGTSTLEVAVFDKDFVSDDELGFCSLELVSLSNTPFVRVSSWLQLQRVSHGTLHLGLTLRPLGSGNITDQESPVSDRPRDEYGFPMSLAAAEAKKRLSRNLLRTSKDQRKNWQKLQWWKLCKDSSQNQIKQTVRKGIPYSLRGEVWQLLCGSKERRIGNPTVYSDLIEQFHDVNSPAVTQIAKDLHRTFPGHRIFDHPQGKEALRNTLIAYAFRNQHIGYCQSMNFITAVLLLFMSEEEAFWTLDTIIEKYLSDYFAGSMIGMKADTSIFNKLISERRPKLYEHFISIGFSIETVTTQWFLSLFVNLTPTETCLRILDSFFADGTTAFFAASIGIIDSCEEDLMQVTDFDEAFVCLQQAAARAFDPETILKVGFSELGSFSFEKLLRLRTEAYQVIQQQQKEQDFQVLQRVTSFREHDLEKLCSHFKSVHVSNLGSIDFESFQELLGLMEIRDPILLSQLFKQFDDNGDGSIDFREFICGLNLLATGTFEEKLLMVFKTFDLDANGYLDIDEIGIMFDIQYKMLGTAVRISRHMVEKIMSTIDHDGNGKISFSEFKECFHRLPLLSQWMQLISTKTAALEVKE